MGRTTQQNTAATVKAIAGATIQKGDLLYSDPVNYNVLPVPSSAMPLSVYVTAPLVAETVVNSEASNTFEAGHATLSNGDFVYSYANGSHIVKFARYNASGVLQGAITTVDTAAAQVAAISITPLNNGGFAIGWTHGTASVKAAIYNASGTQTVAPFVVEAVNSQSTGVSLATLNNNNFVITYGNSTTNSRYAIYNESGVSQLAPTTVRSADSSGFYNGVSVASITDGGFVIAIKDGISGCIIYKYNSAGTSVTTVTIAGSNSQPTNNLKVLNAGADNIIVLYNNNTNSSLNVARFTNALVRISEPSASGTTTTDGSYNPFIFIDLFTGSSSSAQPDAYTLDAKYNTTNQKLIVVLRGSSKSYYGIFDRTAKLENGWQLLNPASNYLSIAINNTGFQIAYRSTVNNFPTFIVNSLTLTANTTFSFPPTLVDGTTQQISKSSVSIINQLGAVTGANPNKSIALTNGHILTVAKCNYTDNSWMFISDIYGNIKLTKYITNWGGNGTGGNAQSIDACLLSNGNIAVVTQQQSASAQNRGLVYIFDQSGNPVLTSPIVVYNTSSSAVFTIRVAAFSDGQFAVAYNEGASSISGKIYTNAGVQVGSTVTGVLSGDFSNNFGQTFNMAITTNNNIVIIGQYSTIGPYFMVKTRDFVTTIITNSLATYSGAGMHHEVVATSDGGWIFMYASGTAPWQLLKYNASGTITNSASITGYAVSNDFGRICVDSQNNLYVATRNAGSVYQVLKYNSNLTPNTTYSFPVNPNQTLQIAFNKNAFIIAYRVDISTFGIAYTLFETAVVGIAAEAGTVGQTIDMSVDGVIELRENWLPAAANYLSALPSGIKGSIYGFTAELTRQRNNLG